MKNLIVLVSVHHGNTKIIAEAIAKELKAEIKSPRDVDPADLREYDLVGFGSGIYNDRHHPLFFDLASKLPLKDNGKAFLFSTSGVPVFLSGKSFLKDYSEKCHAKLAELLATKGYRVTGNFCCPGFDTNSFLKYFGGLNKGRPNADDLRLAAEFARSLI